MLNIMMRAIFRWRWLPIFVTGVVVLVPINAWYLLKSNEDTKILQFVEMHAHVVRDSISQGFGEGLLEIIRIRSCPDSSDRRGVDEWRSRSELTIGHHPEIKMVACFSREDGRSNMVATDYKGDGSSENILQQQQRYIDREKIYTNKGITAWFTQDVRPLLVLTIPLMSSSRSYQSLVSFIDVSQFLNGIHSIALPDSFGLRVSSKGVELFNSDMTLPEINRSWEVEKIWNGPADRWSIHVWPTAEVVDNFRSRATYTPLIFGPLLATLFGFIVYISQRRIINLDLLSESNRRLKAIVESIHEAIFTIDTDRRIISCNYAAQLCFSCSESELMGSTFRQLFPEEEEYQKFTDNLLPALTRDGYYKDEVLLKQFESETFPAEIKVNQLRLGGESMGLLVIIHDLTKDKRADYDVLTGLPNRALFYERLLQALNQASRYSYPIAVLFLDLDGFKPINDSLGHSMGDELLCQVAQRISHCVREEDTVSRIGGDEFTILLNKISRPEDASLIASNILQALQSPFRMAIHEIKITASIGIAIYPDDGGEAEELVNGADEAMYRVKRGGKNSYQFLSHGTSMLK